MRRDKLLCLAIALAFCLAACGGEVGVSDEPERECNLWTRACVVVDITDYNVVVVEDSVGHQWSFESIEDWDLGDGVSLLLNDNGTELIYDDIIEGVDFYRVDILNDRAAEVGEWYRD